MREGQSYEDALTAQAKRLHDRYVIEVVEALSVCPWAERSRLDGRTRQAVVVSTEPSIAEGLVAIDSLISDDRLEVGFLIFPRFDVGRVEFERFVAELRRADAARVGLSGPSMAMAAFHYDADPDVRSASRLVPFMRRSPDPTVQLIRRTILDELRGPGDHGTAFVDPRTTDLRALLEVKKKPPLHERIAGMNAEKVRELGVEHFEALFAAIRADRDVSYRALLERYR